jgi:hypothetical protein
MPLDDFDIEQQTLREVQANWRELVISRMEPLNGRRVGSLSLAELEVINRKWMPKTRMQWFGIELEEKRHYFALECALQSVHPSLSPPIPAEGATQEQEQKPEPASASLRSEFKLQMPGAPPQRPETSSGWLMPAPVGPRRATSEPSARESCSAQEQVAIPVVEQLAADQLSVPQEEKSGESVSDEAVESQLPEVFRLQTREDVMWKLQRLGPGPAQDTVLEILEATNAALRQATHFDQARGLSDIAEALTACAQKLDMAQTVQDEATAFSIRAEHRYNELVRAAIERGEIGASKRGLLKGRKPTGEPNFGTQASGTSQAPTEMFEGADSPLEETPQTLAQIGINKDKAKRLRRWTGISSDELERRIEEKREEGKLSKAAVLGDAAAPKKRPKVYQPLLSFLKNLDEHPENYDGKILVSDPEMTAIYGRVRARLLGLIENLANE